MNSLRQLIYFALVSLIWFSSSYSAQGQSLKIQKLADKVFKETGEVYFKFKIQDRSEISTVTKIISIDNVKGKTIYAFASKKQFIKFLELGHYKYKILPKPSELEPVQMLNDVGGPKSLTLTAYPTYPQYVAMMQNFAANYPTICKLYTIGTTVDGRSLLILKISDNVNNREYEPQFLYTSTMHGDETAGYIMMLKFIDHLLTNYGSNPRVNNLVNENEIWINPLANPDGTYAGGDNTVNGATRANANNVDLNRNYPDFMDGAHPDGLAYQPETMAFMSFADTMDFVMAANFHGGAELFNYPWDTKADDHPDRNWFMQVGGNYVDTLFANSTNYFLDFQAGFDSPGLTDGFAWYEANGGRQDYMNYYRHCREVTIEMSSTKLIPVNSFETIWGYNLNAFIYYIESMHKGFHGLITDQCTGQPVKAKVFINNHDADSSFVFSSLPIGNYYRPIYPGTYSVTYSSPGYQSQTINNLTVGLYQSIEQNITLQPLPPTTNFVADRTSGCGGTIEFTDLTGSADNWLWDFGDGTSSTLQNPSHVYTQSGTYSVQLNTGNCAGSDALTRTDYVSIQVVEPALPSQTAYNACSAQSFTLQASGSGDLVWYDSPTATASVAAGSTFTTPVLNNNATYYVANTVLSYTGNVGSTSANSNGGFYTAGTYHYLIFDALSDFTLESVQVNAGNSGNRIIELRNSNGVVLQSLPVSIPQGVSTVLVGFSIQAGTGYQLGMAGGSNLYRNNAGASYPYTDNTTVSITGNSANQAGYYYYFYNWQVSQKCASDRVSVPVYVGNGNPPTLTLSSSAPTICSNSPITLNANATNVSNPSFTWTVNGVVSTETGSNLVINTPTNGTVICEVFDPTNCSGTTTANSSFNLTVTDPPTAPVISLNGGTLTSNVGNGIQWYVNGIPIDGASSATFIPLIPGDYTAIITSNGCSSAISNTISFTPTGMDELAILNQIKLFPNPSHDFIHLSILPSGTYEVEVYDALGQLVGKENSLNPGNGWFLDVRNFHKGWYILKIACQAGSVRRPFVVEK